VNRDDIDIFAFNLGGSVSDMMRDPEEKSDPFLTEEQAAYFAAQMLPGAATIDAAGNMPSMPSSDADLIDIFDAGKNPSILENIRQGRVLDPALQALGVLGDASYAIPGIGIALGSALKAPGALSKTRKLKAFHGSPHNFDAFSTANIGTGEGAQAYGRGLYFAEREATAKGYKRSTNYADKKRQFQKELPDDASIEEVVEMAEEGVFSPEMSELIKALADDDFLGFDYPSQAITAALGKNIDDFDPSPRLLNTINSGHMYEVAIDADADELLDFDLPLLEQKKLLSKLDDVYGDHEIVLKQLGLDLRDNPSGVHLIDALGMRRGNQPDTPPLLKDIGVKGIQYADALTRFSPGQKTKNYVIFDERLIEISKKYGITIPAAAVLLEQSLAEAQDEPIKMNMGGSVSEMMRDPKLKREPITMPTGPQVANFAANFPPGAAILDATGNMPGMVGRDAGYTDIFSEKPNLSLGENIGEGNYGTAVMQGMGVLGDSLYGVPFLGATIGSVLKVPRAIQKTLQAGESLSDATDRLKIAYEAAPNSAKARKSYLDMRSARDAAGETATDAVDVSYRMSHQPTGPGGGARLDDMTGGGEVFPDDIYSSKGLQYYGNASNPADKESYKIIQAMKGKPDKSVTVYRAVPPGVKDINPGDFVTLSKKYAEDHAFSGYGSRGEDAGDVISMKVRARDVYSPGDDLNEFGYFPDAPAAPTTGGIDSLSQDIVRVGDGVESIDAARIVSSKTKLTKKQTITALKNQFMSEHPPVGSLAIVSGKPKVVDEALIRRRANAYVKKMEAVPAVFRREAYRLDQNIQTIPMQQRNIIHPEMLIGKTGVPVVGDRSIRLVGDDKAGRGIMSIRGVPLSSEHIPQGGIEYSIDNLGRPISLPDGSTSNRGWASMEDAANKKQGNMVLAADKTDSDDILGIYSAMSRNSINFSADALIPMMKQLPAIKIPKKDIKAFDDAVRTGITKTDADGKVTTTGRPDWLGLEHPEVFDQLLGKGEFPRDGAGAFRKTVLAEMTQKKWENLGFPLYDDMIDTMTVPELGGFMKGESGLSMFKADPSASTFDDLDHLSYGTSIPGEYFGGLAGSLPPEVMYPEMFEMLSRKMTDPKKGTPRPLSYDEQVGSLMMDPKLYEQYTPEKVEKIIEYMNKNLGTNYAEGGEVNADLIDIFDV